jgi:putative (di)nucleoside polyphosphate hydrolase
MIDENGFRANIGMIVMNDNANLLWARRLRQNAWQFPQGGLAPNETPTEALYRELYEELGLIPEDVKILGSTREWLHYRIPSMYIRHNSLPLCIGQKQKWFLIKLLSDSSRVCLNKSDTPEFDSWRWVDYWYPVKRAVYFKRQVYKRALREFFPIASTYHDGLNLEND